MNILKALGATAILATTLGFATSASAYDGCGWGAHMNAWGNCRPNYRPMGFYGPRPAYGYGYGYRPAYGYAPRPAYGYGYRPGFSVSFRPF